MPDPFDDENFVRALVARSEATRKKFGIALPIVDWAAPQPRNFLACDEDELCKWIVEQHPELRPEELIIENAAPGIVTVLYAATARDTPFRFVEIRLEIELEDDLVWYTERVYFTILRSEVVLDQIEEDRFEPRTPRWFTRVRDTT